MKLRELCEPLFQEVCRLNRLARKGGGSGAELGRDMAKIRGIFDEMKNRAAGDVALASQFDQVQKPLVYFVDSMLSKSSLSWASEWPWLEEEKFGELVGQTRFFELLDETLADHSPAATERLEIFYTAMGLGFAGFYSDEPEYLRRKMLEIQNRISKEVELRPSKFIPKEELAVNTTNLYEPPGRGLAMLGIALLGLVAVLFVATVYLYYSSQSELGKSLEEIGQFSSVARREPAEPAPKGDAGK